MGDPDKVHRLDDKLKAVTTRKTPMRNTALSFDVTQLLKRPQPLQKPSALEPIRAPTDPSNFDVAYGRQGSKHGSLAKNDSMFLQRHGSQTISRTMQAVMPNAAGGGAVGH